jgi:hypothetical protein
MPVPFGGHPPLRRFLEWAQENGCTVELKLRTHTASGRPYRSLEMVGPAGGRAIVVNPDLDEHLAPSMVSYLQRRLGVKSPFPGAPEQPDPNKTEFVQEDGMPFDPPQRSKPKT